MSEHIDENGDPFTLAATASFKGRRLWVDGKPFPWATHGTTFRRKDGVLEMTVTMVLTKSASITPYDDEETARA